MNSTNVMKLSKKTIDILKNYSSINSNILINSGNKISTISPVKTILSEAEVDENFDVSFGIWDLPKFLGTVSLFNDPDFDFQEKFVVISDGNRSVKYHYCEPKLLTVPTKKINMPKSNVSFLITNSELNELKKAASILGVSDLTVEPNDDEGIIIKVHDKKDNGSNSYVINIDEDVQFDGSFCSNFMIENLKLYPGDYEVQISSNVVSKFKNTNSDISYWIALEMDSSYSN